MSPRKGMVTGPASRKWSSAFCHAPRFLQSSATAVYDLIEFGPELGHGHRPLCRTSPNHNRLGWLKSSNRNAFEMYPIRDAFEYAAIGLHVTEHKHVLRH
jgi:hypothetical protein